MTDSSVFRSDVDGIRVSNGTQCFVMQHNSSIMSFMFLRSKVVEEINHLVGAVSACFHNYLQYYYKTSCIYKLKFLVE